LAAAAAAAVNKGSKVAGPLQLLRHRTVVAVVEVVLVAGSNFANFDFFFFSILRNMSFVLLCGIKIKIIVP